MRGTVVFDLDGTLADTAADLIAAANDCFESRGLGTLLDPTADAGIAFHGGRAMLRAGYGRMAGDMLLPNDAEEVDFHRLLDFYGRNIARHTRLYDGVIPALDALEDAGFTLTVCTNKPEALAHSLLEELAISTRFKALIGADTLSVRKPDPVAYRTTVARVGGSVERSFLIGDTETDLKTARAAGVRVALVGFGPEGAAIDRLRPDHVLTSFAGLPPLAHDWLPA